MPGQPQPQSIPWVLDDDKTMVVVVSTSGKTVSTVADALCSLAKDRGITEARMVDHTLEAKMKVGNFG